MYIKSINPATEEVLATYEAHNDVHIENALARAYKSYQSYKNSNIDHRALKLHKLAKILENEKEELAILITTEMGKTLSSARAEIEKCALTCNLYANKAHEYLTGYSVSIETAKAAYVRYFPIGPILAVMPWNFPFWQVFRFAAPAIMAGNTILLKHASNVPQCALAIESLFWRAGFEESEFQTLLIGSDRVEKIISDRRIRAVTLTGSEGAGASVASCAGKHIKKLVLELGGSDPFIVMPSCDIEMALTSAVRARTQNSGQSCIAAKRFFIHASIYKEFTKELVTRFSALKTGDPLLETTDLGPLATQSIRQELDNLVSRTIEMGASPLIGATVQTGKGYFYSPGLLENIPENSPAFTEEIFGPVGLLFRVNSLEEAIVISNSSRFGLGSSIFTSDPDEIEKAIAELEAGVTFVNAVVASDPQLPFGGIKSSGYGRELGVEGIREFVNTKTILIR